MSDTEARRLELYNVLQEVLGNDPATTLMSHLQPTPIPDLLTKEDFQAFRSGEFASFQTEMREFKTEVNLRFDSVNRRIDRILLAVVAGQFVLLAAILRTAAL